MAASSKNHLRLCDLADVTPGTVKRIEVTGFPPLAVYNVDGTYYVTDDTCTHGGASLADGYLDGDTIECPFHTGRFCIRTGEAVGFPAVVPIRTYTVTIADGEILLQSSSEIPGSES